jgi:hypothetical protein
VSDPICFSLDEHIPSAVAEGLRHRGVEVMMLDEAEILGAAR